MNRRRYQLWNKINKSIVITSETKSYTDRPVINTTISLYDFEKFMDEYDNYENKTAIYKKEMLEDMT